MAKSAMGELEQPKLPGHDLGRQSKGDLPIDPPKPKPEHPLVELVGEQLQAYLAGLPVHDGDVPRVTSLVHNLQQLTDPGSLYAVKLAAERHLASVLQLAKAAKDADAAAEQEAKAAALKQHRAEKTEKDEKDAA